MSQKPAEWPVAVSFFPLEFSLPANWEHPISTTLRPSPFYCTIFLTIIQKCVIFDKEVNNRFKINEVKGDK